MNLIKNASWNINRIRYQTSAFKHHCRKAINQLGANVNPQSLITRSSGQILQSNLELLFNNVTLRSFPFTFDFTPREPAEAEMVRRLLEQSRKQQFLRKVVVYSSTHQTYSSSNMLLVVKDKIIRS